MRAAAAGVGILLVLGCGSPLSRARQARAEDPQGEAAQAHYRKAMTRPSQARVARRELAALHVDRGNEAVRGGDFAAAEREFRQALTLEPRAPLALEAMARLRLQQARPRDAHEWAERAIAAGCSECRRLAAAVRVHEAEAASRAGEWRVAEAAYAEAFEVVPSAPIALGLARARYALRRLGGAVSALRHALELLGPQDVSGRDHFVDIRGAIVLLALHEGEIATADAVLDLSPPGLALEGQLEAILEATAAMQRAGAPTVGARRLERVVAAAEAGQIQLEPRVDARVRDQLARLYAASARSLADAGRLEDAEAALERALRLDPESSAWMLERAVLEVAQGDLAGARQHMEAASAAADGRAEVEAIVLAYEAMAYLELGERAAAQTSVEAARQRAAELPEVRLASATLLAAASVEGLPRGALRELQSAHTIRYPAGVVRVGEALAELDAAERMLGSSVRAPRRAADVGDRVADLQRRLRTWYPWAVAYRSEPTAVLHVHHGGSGEHRFEIRPLVAGSRVQTAILAPGQDARFEVRGPAVVRITAGTRTEVVLAEPHAMISIPW